MLHETHKNNQMKVNTTRNYKKLKQRVKEKDFPLFLCHFCNDRQ